MNRQSLDGVSSRLEFFLRELTSSMGRSERRYWAQEYIKGLLLDGERKSIEPLAHRVNGDVQSMQQFIGQSPWSAFAVQEALNRHMYAASPAFDYWIIDETSFPKAGEHSVGVQRQYCGALGKIANCQIAASLHASGELGGFPLGWKLYLPKQWLEDKSRCTKAGIPKGTTYRTCVELSMDLIDEAIEQKLTPAPILADCAYGNSYNWRMQLQEKQLEYCVSVEPKAVAWLNEPNMSTPPYSGLGRPRKRHSKRAEPMSLREIAQQVKPQQWWKVNWREGTKGPMSSCFTWVRVWAAHDHKRGNNEQRKAEWLIIEWPEDKSEPINYWLGHWKQQDPHWLKMIEAAKGRWRIEQDYRELKDELGLDHFEGRGFLGWNHHVVMVTLALAFLRIEQLRVKKNFWSYLTSN